MYLFSRSFIVIIIIILFMLSFSCNDLGIQAPIKRLSSSRTVVTLGKDSTTQLILSGGITPYIIRTSPDTLIAKATIAFSTLIVVGVDTGKTTVIINDNKTPIPDTVIIQINVVIQSLSQNISFLNQIQPIFDNYLCINCHPGNGGLDLTTGASYGKLVNVSAVSSCITLLRVLPGDANNSVLYRKVAGTSCGAQMPVGSMLAPSDIVNIKEWINQGALNN